MSPDDNAKAVSGDVRTVAFIGLGLIGGSIAKAMKKSSGGCYLMAWNPHMEKVQAAISDGVIDKALNSLTDPKLNEADMVFLCAPVERNRENLKEILPLLKPSATITDIGSVKTDIHLAAEELGIENRFVGGHPMAGSERTGYYASKGRLLENAYYIVTASGSTEKKRVELVAGLAKSLGAIPIMMDYREHDRVVAAVSHVPHVIASSLVHLVKDSDTGDHLMKTIAAGGFKDITRIASSSPYMWEQICMTNGGNITGLLDQYIDSLSEIRDTIDKQNSAGIRKFFAGARDYRDSFIDASSGPIKAVHVIHVDIADEPGVIATVATLLAVHTINIRNIGITHNRELERGALRIEVETADDIKTARTVLTQHGYSVS